MAPRSASGGRGAAASTAVASSSNSQASTSKSTINPLMELNLLQHINGIRQVPNFVAFDIFAQSTGADWMEGMLAQAKDIRRQWSTEYIASSRDQRGAQAARIAGEMLKTPSRKRAANVRAQGRAVSRKLPKEIASDPFNDAENKENASVQHVKASAPAEPVADASSHSVGAARGTRSRADKAQIAKLPNPFQTKLLQAKAKAEQSREAVETTTPALPESKAAHEVELAAAEVEAEPAPQVKSKEKAKAPPKLTKKQLAEQKKKEVAAASEANASERESEQIPPTATQPKGRGKAKAKAKVVEAGVVPEPAAAAEAAPLPSSPPSPIAADESMQVDMTFAEGPMTEQPRASTPTGKKNTGKLLDRMLAEEGIAPIQDDEHDSDESYSSAEENKDAPPAESVTKTIEMTQSTRDGSSGSLLSSSNSGSSVGATTAAPTPAPPPKQKRTLASFGGSKKSLGYGLQSHNSSTPANAGFKSSFLNKSLRKAQTTGSSGSNGVEGEEEDSDEDDSMVGTKANTEANAAAMLGVKAPSQREVVKSLAAKPSVSAALPERSAGSKRKSKEMNQDGDEAGQVEGATRPPAPKLARTLSDRSEKDLTQASGFAKATNASASKTQPAKLPTTSNLLRTKLESARLQKSTNTSVVGLGARGLSSPILGRAAAPSSAAPAEAAAVSSPATSAAKAPRPSGPSVASLRGQWEAKAHPTRTSPRKSNLSESQSNPPPASTTPLNSPVKENRKAAPAASSGMPAVTEEQTRTKALVDEDKAVEAQLGIASPSSAAKDVLSSPKLSQLAADEDDDETSLLNDDEGDADDESDDKDEDGKTTKVMRPLSAAAQTTHSQSRATSSEGNSAQNTKSAIYFSGNNDSGDTYGDDDEFTLEELEGKKAPGVASATSSAASTAVIKPATGTTAAANTAKAGEGAPGASQWGHKLKSLFNINGAALPGVIGASGPTPGTGFQPKTSRTLSGSVSAQKDVTISTAPREPHAAPALGASTLGGGVSKPASVIRADQLRRKEAEEAERRLKEQEEKRKQAMANRAAAQKAKLEEEREKERKKRWREEEERASKASSSQTQRPGQQQQGGGSTLGQPAKARLMGQYGAAPTNAGSAPSAKLKSSVAPTNANGGVPGDADGKKRRLSKERDEGTLPRQQATSTLNGAAKGLSGNSSIRPISSVSSSVAQNGQRGPLKPAMNGPTRPQQQTGPSRPGMAHQNSNFSQQNPFQQSQRPGGAGPSQQPARPAASAQQQQHRVQPVPPSPLPQQLDDDDLSLPSIVSEYSDSEDEATQARRARAAVWTKGDALQQALAAQQAVDADLIFGIPQGTVDLETLMPPESAAARARIGRPRSSSANWSGADGLKQWEIDSYNERMNIGGPGYRLPARSGPAAASAAGAPAANGRLGPNGQDARRTVLALGAAAAARHQQQQQQGSHRP